MRWRGEILLPRRCGGKYVVRSRGAFWAGTLLRVLSAFTMSASGWHILAGPLPTAGLHPPPFLIAALALPIASQEATETPSTLESLSEPAPSPAPVAPSTDDPPREVPPTEGATLYRSNEEFAKHAMKLREAALSSIEPRTLLPTSARTTSGAYKWKTDIITTTFWVRKDSTSSWDPKWGKSFGGFDNPATEARLRGPADYRPAAFLPKQNPFYCSLPYNDVTATETKPESKVVIPWFRSAAAKEGQSVCKDRWIAVRNRRNGRIAYCQWSDCGPFGTDHYQYVFGNERPLPNRGGGAGLGISPSVRDYLGAANTDTTDWRFVEAREVPPGPWRKYGANNPFVQAVSPTTTPNKAAPAQGLPSSPEVIVR